MTDKDYIGTDARKLPDGSVAWVNYSQAYQIAYMRYVRGGKLFWVNPDSTPYEEDIDPRPATVIAIIKLGEERPKTFADVPEYEAWEDDANDLIWSDGIAMFFASGDGLPRVCRIQDPCDYSITPDMHRVGMVTGILVDGKSWPVKE